jgi:Flp pilus assembly protein TadD
MSGVLQRAFGLKEGDLDLVQACLDELLPGRSAGLARAMDAGTSLATFLGLPPRLIEALYGRAFAFFDAGHVDRAEATFRALCVLDGQRADHWMGLGICARLRDDLDSAMVAFSTAASLRGDWAVPHFHLFEIHMRRSETKAALDLLPRIEARLGDLTPQMRDDMALFRMALQRRAKG